MCLLLALLTPLLTGWVHEGPRATFTVRSGGQISTTGAGNQPNWLRTDREYEDCKLSFEYKLEQWAEAAVILRAPRLGRPMQAGIAITLAHDFHDEVTPHVTGAVTGARPPLIRQPGTWGDWHSVAVDLRGDHLKVGPSGNVVG